MPYPATPRTWVAGDVLTAAQLNAELRDALLAAFPLGVDAWTGYTPTLTQSATVTKTTTWAKYQRIGRLIVVEFNLAVTGAGTAGQAVKVGVPVAAVSGTGGNMAVGVGYIYDQSANVTYPGLLLLNSTTELVFQPTSTDTPSLLGVAVFSAALAAGDIVSGALKYESAT